MMNSSRGRLAAGISVLACVSLAACSSPPSEPSAPEEPRAEPITLADGSPPIHFEKTIYRIPAGQEIGGVYYLARRGRRVRPVRWTSAALESYDHNVALTDLLKAHGYDAVDTADSLFDSGETVQARFRLAGIMTAIRIDNYIDQYGRRDSEQKTEISIEFRLYDGRTKAVVHQETYSGSGREVAANAWSVDDAFLDAFRKLLADQRFVDAVVSDEFNPVAKERLQLADCSAKPAKLPGSIGGISDAVVTIRTGQTTGSGFLVSSDGFVLTAAHNVSADSEPVVVLGSGLELDASVVRMDLFGDVALLRAPGRSHACVRISQKKPAVGQPIFIIGSPAGPSYSQSVTNGIVSAHREHDTRKLLQTDAIVNPGSSGGPMFDDDGRVVGIVTSKLYGFGYEGMSFGAAIDDALARIQLEFSEAE